MDISAHKEKLQIESLKPKQQDLINCWIRKEDSIGILPTGYGKSICFTLPFLIKKERKNVIVISPLISLMEDQRRGLNKKGIKTLSFNSTVVFDSCTDESDLVKLKTKKLAGILYFSPESFMKWQDLIKSLLKKKLVTLFAIDECHCVTNWSDFRDNYNNLSIIKDLVNEYYPIPIMALTATATPSTIQQITAKLNLTTPTIIKTSFNKPQLSITFHRKVGINDGDMTDIYNLIKKNNCKTIIYCKTKKETEKISDRLNKKNLTTAFYHGDMNTKHRTKVQDDFTSGAIDIIVATIAFGMGIDIHNIYLIIHYGISKDIESYYQEIGRAGRDFNESECHLFWSEGDFRLNRFFVSQVNDSELQKAQYKQIEQVERFIYTDKCRMKYILSYFGETDFTTCKKCDNCLKLVDSQIKNDYKVDKNDLGIILKTMYDNKSACQLPTLINILIGKITEQMSDRIKERQTFGYYKKKDLQLINKIIDQITDNDKYLEKNKALYNITEKGTKYINEHKDDIDNLLKSKKKLPTNTNKRWTKEMEDQLISLMSTISLKNIAKTMDRTERSIQLRYLKLNKEDKLTDQMIENCSFTPSLETIKCIKNKYDSSISTKENQTKFLSKNSYFDIQIAMKLDK